MQLSNEKLVAFIAAAFLPLAAIAADVPVKTENLSALNNGKKVVISSFVVEFQQRYEKTSRGLSLFGLGNAGSSTAMNDVTLPDSSTLQLITNFAYLEMVKKLKAKGIEVVQANELSEAAKPAYEKLTKGSPISSGLTLDNVDGDSVLFTPDGLISIFPLQGCGHYEPEQKLSKLGAGFGAMGRTYATAENAQMENLIAKAQGNVPLLKVWLTVGFGNVDAKGGNAFISERQKTYAGTTTTLSNSANAEATAGMFLKPEVTRFSLEVPTNSEYRYTYSQSCGTQVTKWSKAPPPADGDVLIQLAEKYRDDGSNVVSLENQAGTVGVTDTHIGGGIGIRTVKENNAVTQSNTATAGQAVRLDLKGSNSSGTVSTNGMGTTIHTTSQYATSIRADYYATSAIKMIDDVTGAFIRELSTGNR